MNFDGPSKSLGVGSMNWEPIRKRLLGADLDDTLRAATELRENIEIVHSTEFPLMLSALLPAFSSILAHRTRPTPDINSTEHKVRHTIIDIISKMPANEVLRPHAPHLVAVAIDILNRDYEENALLASRIIFDLYKVYRSLPQDYVQPYVDFVINSYRSLPVAIQRNFTLEPVIPSGADLTTVKPSTETSLPTSNITTTKPMGLVPTASASITSSSSVASAKTAPESSSQTSLRSNMSFRVLTECPLMIMLMFQLYPKYVHSNIPVLIAVMMEALSIRPPKKYPRQCASRSRELIAAQAKTLSFLTYLLRSFSNDLKPYEERLANNVVSLMAICPHESVATRKELLVATRHLLNSDFRKGFFRHVDTLFDERVIIGSRFYTESSTLRPLGYTTLSDLVQHVRNILTMPQMARVVGIFARVLHDSTLPMSTLYIAVRTLLSVVDIIFHNTDPNPQLGRDLLVRILQTMILKLESLCSFSADVNNGNDSIRDVQNMIRAIIVGHKTVIIYIHNYRAQRSSEVVTIPTHSNEEVSSALLKLTFTELAIIDHYIPVALKAITLLKVHDPSHTPNKPEKTLEEQHRDAFTYFATTFASMEGHTLRRTLGRRLDVLFDAIVEDPTAMIIPRHLLASNPTTSAEFCAVLLDYLLQNFDLLALPRPVDLFFLSTPVDRSLENKAHIRMQVAELSQCPAESHAVLCRKSTTALQLFERLLKSMSVFSENEPIIRKDLRRLVAWCLRHSMEKTSEWPDNHCLLLRYIFRSVSAGKFEDSYRELLPLVPTVLNGLCRSIGFSQSCTAFVHMAVELCLTIPARLSSLLPHLNLLLRMIVLALESSSGDLVNLGLRTLEFWVDNLNPQFLYPELSKQKDLFARLMQSLSRHLRPAPYPYGLLTLRLLGKLGGKNREFLREPMLVAKPMPDIAGKALVECKWNHTTEMGDEARFALAVPFGQCVRTLQVLATAEATMLPSKHGHTDESSFDTKLAEWKRKDTLWTCDVISGINFKQYSDSIAFETMASQAAASLQVLQELMKNHLVVPSSLMSKSMEDMTMGLLYATMLNPLRESAWEFIRKASKFLVPYPLTTILSRFLTTLHPEVESIGRRVVETMLELKHEDFTSSITREQVIDSLAENLCDGYINSPWNAHRAFQSIILHLLKSKELSRKHEFRLVSAAFVVMKTIPSELCSLSLQAASFVIRLCGYFYNWSPCYSTHDDCYFWDPINFEAQAEGEASSAHTTIPTIRPCEEVLRLILQDIAATQQLTRFTARFILVNIFLKPFSEEENAAFFKDQIPLIRRTVFSRSLRLLSLPQQVSVVEGLAVIVKSIPGLIPLSDQHLLAFLSELLKMLSVADGEMVDKNFKTTIVDKNGFVEPPESWDSSDQSPSHAACLFFRRECVVIAEAMKVAVPEELPIGVQMRVSSINLMHAVVRCCTESFFDADSTTPIGNIRPHVVSLLFRSLVSVPTKAVDAAYHALRDVLTLSIVVKSARDGEKSQPRLPKELLQTCIRPVLLHLRDYTKLSIPLLRGLARLLSLLSSWFNKTLGEKLLDHLQKWTDPTKIIGQKSWKQGDELHVAAAVVDIFADLPHASHFVEPLVKTCIKLEATFPAFKARFIHSPFRKPLARYLNRHPQYTASFFFQRLKTPMYSELFQSILELPESGDLRSYLGSKSCSVMILNVCFERPLAIIRSEKGSPTSPVKTSLALHGIQDFSVKINDESSSIELKPMTTESLELQLQGFRLVKCLLSNKHGYIQEHNDIVRAFRWLWRSKGRFLRLQHDDMVPPRYHCETSMLASFLMSYAKALPNDDLDILFELIRVFLQPSSSNFTFVSRFLETTLASVLTTSQKKQVFTRFFVLFAGDSTEETKMLSIQYLILPMFGRTKRTPDSAVDDIVDATLVEKFTNEVLFRKGVPITCGVRLKIELLKILEAFLASNPSAVEPYRKDIVKFCWGLLKSDDVTCKGWAYFVVSLFIKFFETPSKIVVQVYMALLRSHQQEGKDLVKRALDELVPVLPQRLSPDEFKRVVERTSHLMLEESNSSPQQAHIIQMLVNSPKIFFESHQRFVGYLVNALNRLGLPPNCPLENRTLAIGVVGLLLEWHEQRGPMESYVVSFDQIDVVTNFLVRLKFLMVETTDSRSQKAEQNFSPELDLQVKHLFRKVVSQWDANIRAAPFEKAALRDQKLSDSLLLSCLEVFGIMAVQSRLGFFIKNPALFREILSNCFKQAKECSDIRNGLLSFADQVRCIGCIAPVVMNGIDQMLLLVYDELRTSNPRRSSDATQPDSSRGRDRPGVVDEQDTVTFPSFVFGLCSVMCRARKSNVKLISTALCSVLSALTRNHIAETAAKHKQGSSSASRAAAPGSRSHTPTSGILDELLTNSAAKTLSAKLRTKEMALHESSYQVDGIVEILSIFERSDLPFLFTTNRRILFDAVSNLLDSSDTTKVLVICVRIAGKWILADCSGTTLTSNERSSLLLKISALDYTGIDHDLELQLVADTISIFVHRLLASQRVFPDAETRRCLVSCLLYADHAFRNSVWTWLSNGNKVSLISFWQLLYTDMEGLGGRFWITVLAEGLLRAMSGESSHITTPLSIAIHSDATLSLEIFEILLKEAWNSLPSDQARIKIGNAMELLLSRPYHTQFLASFENCGDKRCGNALRSFLNGLLHLKPLPVIDLDLLVFLAEYYNSWHEVLYILESQHKVYVSEQDKRASQKTLTAMRRCYGMMKEDAIWLCLASTSCKNARSRRVLSKDLYGMISEAVEGYASLMSLVEAKQLDQDPSLFEMNLWEERWVQLHRDLCQIDVVSEYAEETSSSDLLLECAWKTRDWNKVRSLCSSSAFFSAVEKGEPVVKLCETLLAVADGKLGDVENLHAQTAQLCLYKWQLLPALGTGSASHSSLLHLFHRLVEIRESGQIMVETKSHAGGGTLPDLKNLLNAWRYRLPNDWDPLSRWDDVFTWRGHMFTAITSNFRWAEPNELATLHDRPWTVIRMAKTARKQGLRDVSLLLLSKTSEELAMSVSDAFLKLREQILAYFSRDSELERHGGLNIINTTNLSFFDENQKSELFRLKATFLASLGGRSKSNQAYCHSVQICSSYARSWSSWGELCNSLGAVAEKQADSTIASPEGDSAATKDSKTNATKKVSQYLAQAMGCYLEAVRLDGHEWARIHIPRCLWMLNKDGSSHGVLCQTLEERGLLVPVWMWLPWIPQLLTSFYRTEKRAVKAIFSQLVKAYPQAVYYPLRSFYLERRDVERSKSPQTASSQQMGSVSIAEVMMSLLRKSHASLWSSLESILEELIVKFRPSYEEELLSTLIALLERADTQVGSIGKKEDEEAVTCPVWKTLGRIAVKFFKPIYPASTKHDERSKKTAEFKALFKEAFEKDFDVHSDSEQGAALEGKPSFSLEQLLDRLRHWKDTLEQHVLSSPKSLSIVETSQALAIFGAGNAPDLWPGSCDPQYPELKQNREQCGDDDVRASTSSSASAARKAAVLAAQAVAAAASIEGIGSEYGGGSSLIEIPGQYAPNTCDWADVMPSPELHTKLIKFEPVVEVLRRNDQLVRRIGMVANDGKAYRFLLQFAVPYFTRTDERTNQMHFILDKIIRKDIGSLRANLSILPQPVIPVAQRLRLTHEPDGRDSLDDLYRDFCTKQGIDHAQLLRRFRDSVKELHAELAQMAEDSIARQASEKRRKLELFHAILASDGAEPYIMSLCLHSKLKGAEPLFLFRRTFAQHWGANCLLQFVFSVAERTPARVAFVNETGRALAPDFRISYSSQGIIENQLVPFRLTPNIVNLIGFPLLDACFTTSMAQISTAVRRSRSELDPILRLLIRDDLVTFYTKSTAKSDAQTQEMEKQLMDRISRNVATLHSRFAECCPSYQINSDNENPVDQKIRDLIATARNPESLCSMPASFQGWL